MRFEFIDHTADVVVKAYGADLDDAFATAAEALFAVITDNVPRNGRKSVSFELSAIDRDGLVVGLLSELILRHEVDQVVLSEFRITLESDTRLRCSAMSEPFDAAKHGEGIHVKGISYHMLEIHEGAGGEESFVQVLFDV